jgi:phage terminase large subunit-like protein
MDPLASAAEARRVPLVNGPWVEPFLQELELIGPGCAHDDQGDSAAGAYQKVTRGGGRRVEVR